MLKGKKSKFLWLGLVLLLVLIVGVVMLQPHSKHDNQNKTEATIKPTQMQPLSESGIVSARHKQALNIPEGKTTLYVNDGASVSAGDVIGQVEDQKTSTAARQELQRLQTQIANATASGKSTTRLMQTQTSVQKQLEKATHVITAPYDGILDIDDEDTNNIKITILSSDKYIESSVTDYDYDSVTNGAKVQVATNTGSLKSIEKVNYVSQVAKDSGKVTSYVFKTTASQKYRIGQQVTLKIKQDKLVLPKSAVQVEGGQQYLYVVHHGRATKEAVKGTRSGDTFVFDANTLDAKVSVIKNPGNRQLDGKKV